jgi:hypothetical protein
MKLLFIHDIDDQNIQRVIPILEGKCSIKQIVLNTIDNETIITHKKERLQIIQNGKLITQNDFIYADKIIFFRWRMKQKSFIRSSLKNKYEKEFAEREWSSLLWGIFLHMEDKFKNPVWINKPHKYFNLYNKYHLLCIARDLGFKFPVWFVSNSFASLERNSKSIITKSISSDEQINNNMVFHTTKLDRTIIKQYSNKIISCPSFLQHYIKPSFEIRTYYLLGKMLTIKLETELEHIDIRDLEKKEIRVEIYKLPSLLNKLIKKFCVKEDFSYCSFDFIFANNNFYLLDVTPNGSWFFYEGINNPIISSWFAQTLIKCS